MNDKRQKLITLSNQAKDLMEMHPELDFETLSQCIVECFYKDSENVEFKTFAEWKKLGFLIKKNSKAFPVWSKPIKAKKKAQDDDGEDKEYKMFGIAYLFSNNQVQEIT